MVKKNKAIFLDDDRQVDFIKDKVNINKYDWIIIRNYFDFVNFIDNNFESITLVSFDHDINSFDSNDVEWTGSDAARYLIDKCLDDKAQFPDFIVHSMNNTGSKNILTDIKHYIDKFERRGDWTGWRYYHTGFVNGKFI